MQMMGGQLLQLKHHKNIVRCYVVSAHTVQYHLQYTPSSLIDTSSKFCTPSESLIRHQQSTTMVPEQGLFSPTGITNHEVNTLLKKRSKNSLYSARQWSVNKVLFSPTGINFSSFLT
uniref:AlNc14C234G9356 protein n=1 Tax=Albugo laibachii Nc14 TaxID=890382 RepID=F0WSL2_9STRA|nr:AlNc14C234G9356 [Albugo laibachii Nc14]|eukprot:CCA24338.1 AlNc14C234G9356 [Albugo laibachii Nc14]